MVAKSPSYFLTRSASASGGPFGLTGLYHHEESGGKEVEPFVVHFKPCNSVLPFDKPRARRRFPETSQIEKPDGWSVPRYSMHVAAPELVDRQARDPAAARRIDMDPSRVDKPDGWGVPRYAGPQIARYVSDPYSDFVRPSRGRNMKGRQGPGADWAEATGRLAKSSSSPVLAGPGRTAASPSASSSSAAAHRSGQEKPDGWNVPRYSPMFYKLQDQEVSLASQSYGSALGGVGDPHRKPAIPDSGGPPGAGAKNPLAALKKAAIEAAARRAAEFGDGVDVPDGWSVPRYAAKPVSVHTNVPKKANTTADDMMKVDPRGRASLTTNVWWPLPKDVATNVAQRGSAGEDWQRTAHKEGRRLTAARR